MGKKEKKQEKEKTNIDSARQGIEMYMHHHLFGKIYSGRICLIGGNNTKSQPACTVTSDGRLMVNAFYRDYLTAKEWFYLIAHQYLHLAFGHFDAEKITGLNKPLNESGLIFQESIWKLACNLYNMKFLLDMKLGRCPFPLEGFEINNQSEREIYDRLLVPEWNKAQHNQADRIARLTGMEGLNRPLVHKKGNPATEEFAVKLAYAAKSALQGVNEDAHTSDCSQKTLEAAEWFIGHYPLLGGLAAGFHIVEDYRECQEKEIQIAAVNVRNATIYVNPVANLTEEEMKFVLAHEFLHAGLMHHERCQGRNTYLWNVACDYVINGWLYELRIGSMPEGVLYDENLRDMSAESIYDRLLSDLRSAQKLTTLRGYGKGDVIWDESGIVAKGNVNLDDFYRNALSQGLQYHELQKRGYLPAGLIEEICALEMPPIPWDVELAKWFEKHFPFAEKHYSYARPSRRQSSSPDIPRPRLIDAGGNDFDRTFGVLIDTSGSMSEKMLGMALGSIASYAQAREVARVRVVFCDARAYDAGYVTPDEIAGRVEVIGRGGTALQPGIDCLEHAEEFPKNGPILIITDGEIEEKLVVKREHAYLLPKGCKLPFVSRGKIFYLEE